MYKPDLTLNNPQGLICHKIRRKQAKPSTPTLGGPNSKIGYLPNIAHICRLTYLVYGHLGND